jgi:hypothetical protein
MERGPLHNMPDEELLRRLTDLVRQSRHTESDLVAHIGEVDERKLYAREASPSMFAYCMEALHLSEAEAYLRISVARASRKHPVLLTMLADGRLHLTGTARLVPHLTRENEGVLLRRAAHRSKRQIEELIAELAARPDVPALTRRLPGPRHHAPLTQPSSPQGGIEPCQGIAPLLELCPDRVSTSERCSPKEVALSAQLRPDRVAPSRPTTPPAVVEPLAPGRYKVQFTASASLHDKLERLQALMRSRVPDGDLATILEEAVTEKLERLEARRFARTKSPRKGLGETKTLPTSRYIPAAVRRAVHERDGAGCRYVDERGRRCSERNRLEFHHQYPFGRDGDHGPSNLGLLCRTHNRYLAEHDYGREAMARHSHSEKRASRSTAVDLTGATATQELVSPRGT